MKCTQCGNRTFIKTNFPLDSFGDGGASVSKTVAVYVCLDCGHYEFFSLTEVSDYKKAEHNIVSTENALEQQKRKLIELENPSTLQKVEEEIAAIESELKSLDITIRRKNELESKHREMRHKPELIKKEIKSTKERIVKLESDLQNQKQYFEHKKASTVEFN